MKRRAFASVRRRGNEQFQFLDEPAVRERLVDFSDARLTRVTFHIPSIHCIACVGCWRICFNLNPASDRPVSTFRAQSSAVV